MKADQATWKIESSPGMRVAVAVGVIVIGVILMIGFRSNEGSGWTEGRTGFALGILLFVVGSVTLVFGHEEVVTVDPANRLITIEKKNWLGRSQRQIAFDDIADACVTESTYSDDDKPCSYHVVISLKSGKQTNLFFGFFPGARDHSVVEARCQRLLANLRGVPQSPFRTVVL